MVEDLRGYSITGLKPMAEEVLASTDSLYAALLKEMLASELKLAPESFHRLMLPRCSGTRNSTVISLPPP